MPMVNKICLELKLGYYIITFLGITTNFLKSQFASFHFENENSWHIQVLSSTLVRWTAL